MTLHNYSLKTDKRKIALVVIFASVILVMPYFVRFAAALPYKLTVATWTQSTNLAAEYLQTLTGSGPFTSGPLASVSSTLQTLNSNSQVQLKNTVAVNQTITVGSYADFDNATLTKAKRSGIGTDGIVFPAFNSASTDPGSQLISLRTGNAYGEYSSVTFDSNDMPFAAWSTGAGNGLDATYYQVGAISTCNNYSGANYPWRCVNVLSNTSATIKDVKALATRTSSGETYQVLYMTSGSSSGPLYIVKLSNPSTGTWTTPTVISGVLPVDAGSLDAKIDSTGNIFASYTSGGNAYFAFIPNGSTNATVKTLGTSGETSTGIAIKETTSVNRTIHIAYKGTSSRSSEIIYEQGSYTGSASGIAFSSVITGEGTGTNRDYIDIVLDSQGVPAIGYLRKTQSTVIVVKPPSLISALTPTSWVHNTLSGTFKGNSFALHYNITSPTDTIYAVGNGATAGTIVSCRIFSCNTVAATGYSGLQAVDAATASDLKTTFTLFSFNQSGSGVYIDSSKNLELTSSVSGTITVPAKGITAISVEGVGTISTVFTDASKGTCTVITAGTNTCTSAFFSGSTASSIGYTSTLTSYSGTNTYKPTVLDAINVTYTASTFETTGTIYTPFYKTDDAEVLISKVSWTGTKTTNPNDLKVYIRTGPTLPLQSQVASDAQISGWTTWCGNSCGASPTAITSTDFLNSFSTLDSSITDGVNDQYFQLKVVFAGDTSTSPILDDLVVDYVLNHAPSATQTTSALTPVQVTPGSATPSNVNTIALPFTTADVDSNNSTLDTYVFYDAGVKLSSEVTNSPSAVITLSNSSLIPNNSLMLIDKELIYKTGSTYVRGVNRTRISSHALNAVVWIMSTDGALTGNYGTITSGQVPSGADYRVHLGTSAQSKGAGKTITWDLKNESNLANISSSIPVIIVVNDRELGSAVGISSQRSVTVDKKAPTAGTISGPTITAGPSATLSIGGFTDATSLEMAISNNRVNAGAYSSWTSYATSYTATTLNCSTNNGENIFTIKVRDQYGNETTAVSSNVRCDTVAPNAPSSLTATIRCRNNYNKPVLIWTPTTPDPGDFAAYYVYRDGTKIGSVTTIGSASSPPSYVDLALADGATAVYTVKAVDNVPNTPNISAASNSLSFTSYVDCGTDTTKPVLSQANIANVTKTTADITWTTNEFADSTVAFSVGSTSFNLAQTNSASVLSHSIGLIGLSCNSQYFLQLRSTDPSNNTGIQTNKDDLSTLQFTTSACAAAPIISNVSVDAASNNATVTWSTTNVDSSAQLTVNGVTYGSTGFDATPRAHSVSTGNALTPGSSYSATILSINADRIESTQSVTINTPALEQTPVVDGTSLAVSSTQCGLALITWKTTGSSDSNVQYGLSSVTPLFGTTVGSATPIAEGQTHSVTLTGLESAKSYTYRVRSSNGAGSGLFPADGTGLTFTSATCADLAPATISSVSVANVTQTGATIMWNTNKSTNALVDYSLAGKSFNLTAGSSALFDPVVSGTSAHAVTLTGLTPGSTYFFRVRSQTTTGIETTDTNGSTDGSPNGYSFATLAGNSPPVISNVTIASVTTEGATISWTTDEQSSSLVDLGYILGSYGEGTQGQATDTSTSHTVVLTGLNSDTTFYFQVRSADAEGLEGVSFSGDTTGQATLKFTTQSTIDTTPPVITGVSATPTTSTATIQFVTNEDALGTVSYGENTQFNAGQQIETLTSKIHTILVSNLSPNTTYYYIVSAQNVAGLTSISDNAGEGFSFKTLAETVVDEGGINDHIGGLTCDAEPPVITSSYPLGTDTVSIRVSNLGSRAATISWTTDEPSASIVEYSKDSQNLEFLGGDINTFEHEHSIDLKPLTYESTYFFQVVLLDGCGNQERSDVYQFSTLAPGPNEQEEELQGEIDKGASAEQLLLLDKLGQLSSTTQSLIKGFLDGLGGIDSAERDKVAEIIITTIIGPPRILGAQPNVTVNDRSAVVEWETLSETTGVVRYATSASYDPNKENPYGKSAGESEEFLSTHRIVLLDLLPFTTYHYQISGSERSGRKALSIDRTFKTSPVQPKFESIKILSASEQGVSIQWITNLPTTGLLSLRNLATGEGRTQEYEAFSTVHDQTILGLAERTDYRAVITARSENGVQIESAPIRFTTRPDNEAPVIDQVRTKLSITPGKTTAVQAVVSWRTNEPASGRVLYDEGVQGESLRLATDAEADLTLSHVLVLSNLRPGTIYTFKVESRDLAGNSGISREFRMYTPRKSESVLELIIKNFEEAFGFLQ